jgi:CubicO group peptidase (beta-lactamase class C family)
MSTGGLSRARLGRMHEVMAGHVERGDVPGLVTLISRRGEVHVDTLGVTEIGGAFPMQRDTIFRITSMTKPVTAAAALILVEECRLRLDEPVDRLLPELANRQVLRRIDGPLDETVPAHRPITLRDLLTFRLGFGQIMGPPDAYPIQRAVSEQQIMTLGPPKPPTPHAPDEWMRRLATLPLMYQPGERWMYNTGFEVLGVLIARLGPVAPSVPRGAHLPGARHARHLLQRAGREDRSVPPQLLGGRIGVRRRRAPCNSQNQRMDLCAEGSRMEVVT